MHLHPKQAAALAAVLRVQLARPEYQGLTAGEIHALLHEPRVEYGPPQPVRVKPAELVGVLSTESRAKLAAWVHAAELFKNAGSRDLVEGLLLLALAEGRISDGELAALLELFERTTQGPQTVHEPAIHNLLTASNLKACGVETSYQDGVHEQDVPVIVNGEPAKLSDGKLILAIRKGDPKIYTLSMPNVIDPADLDEVIATLL